MSAPVLTNSQKSKTLSAKVNTRNIRPTTIIRNVLGECTPLFCPHISEEKSSLMKEKLKNIFTYTPPASIKWAELKNLSKDKRKELKAKAQYLTKVKLKQNNIIFGVNSVTRAVEKKDASLVMLANDISPELIIKHVIQASNIHNIPIMKVPALRTIMKECFGFAAIAVAFKNMQTDNPLYGIVQMIENFIPSRNFKPNKNIENSSNDNNLDNELVDEMKCNNKETNMETESNPYLYRKSKAERCFVPTKRKEQIKDTITTAETLDFIPFADEPDSEATIIYKRQKNNTSKHKCLLKNTEESEENPQITPTANKSVKTLHKSQKKNQRDVNRYKPLKIKRLKSNVDRLKKKK